MATAATIKKNIAKLEAALKSKATPKSLKSKLETQLVKSKAELSGLNKGTKPKTSSAKSAQSALKSLKDLVNKNKKYKNYKGAGVDLERDADRPAKPIGRRTAKASGKTYYEYRANRIDVKQPPKRYPKLEKGGYFAEGGEVGNFRFKKGDEVYAFQFASDKNRQLRKGIDPKYVVGNIKDLNLQKWAKVEIVEPWNDEKYWETYKAKLIDGHYDGFDGKIKKGEIFVVSQGQLSKSNKRPIAMNYLEEIIKSEKEDGYMAKGGEMKHDKLDEMVEKYQTWLDKNNLPQMSADELLVDESVNLTKEQRKYIQNFSNEWDEEQDKYAKGGMSQGYNDREDERLGMKDGKMSMKDLHSTHARRDDARFEERMEKGGYMADGGEIYKLADNMTDAEYEKKLNSLNEKQKNQYDILVRLGDSPKLALATTLLSKEAKWDNDTTRAYTMAKGGYFAEGGISEKEVVESNAEMVLSQIKAVKHHAMELSNVVSKNSDIEAWVVAKIERASTDLSDITHYLEFQTKKMAMGGEIHRTQD